MANRYYQPPIARPTQEEREIIDLLSPQEKKEALLYFGRAKLGQLVISHRGESTMKLSEAMQASEYNTAWKDIGYAVEITVEPSQETGGYDVKFVRSGMPVHDSEHYETIGELEQGVLAHTSLLDGWHPVGEDGEILGEE